MSEEVEKPKIRPRLIAGNLQVAVVCPPPDGSPFGEYTARVKPFNRAEKQDYFDAIKPFFGADGQILPGQRKAFREFQSNALAVRIVEWDAEFAEGEIAPRNGGMFALLPEFAYEGITDAIFGAAGTVAKN